MRALLQRVREASVTVDGELISAIGYGYLVLFGAGAGDTEEDAQYLAGKIARLRVMTDENGKMNRSVTDISGEILSVSQFTLYANCAHGNRPDFFGAEKPERAKELYEYFNSLLRDMGIPVSCGIFGADMKVSLINDGPVTILLDSKDRKSGSPVS